MDQLVDVRLGIEWFACYKLTTGRWSNDISSTKIYDKGDAFNFDIVNFPFLDGDVPHSPSNGVYISQLIRFARVCSHVDDFNNRN